MVERDPAIQAKLDALLAKSSVQPWTEEMMDEPTGGEDISDEEFDEWMEYLRESRSNICRICRVNVIGQQEANTMKTQAPVAPAAPAQTIEERLQAMKREQGVVTRSFDEMLGFGKECFDSDGDFEDFLQSIRDTRAERG